MRSMCAFLHNTKKSEHKLTQSHSQNESEIEQSAQAHYKVFQPTKNPHPFQNTLPSVVLSHHLDISMHASKENPDQL